MQDKQITNMYENHPQILSSRELRLIAKSEEPLQTTRDISLKDILQLILILPANYREMAIQTIAEQYVTAIRLRTLQLVALFYQHAEEEGVSVEDRFETLQDIEAGIQEIMTLNQRLNIDSMEKFFSLGKLAVSIKDITQSDTAEEAQRALYSISSICLGTLERDHLITEEQPK
jgi:hypothetical protein